MHKLGALCLKDLHSTCVRWHEKHLNTVVSCGRFQGGFNIRSGPAYFSSDVAAQVVRMLTFFCRITHLSSRTPCPLSKAPSDILCAIATNVASTSPTPRATGIMHAACVRIALEVDHLALPSASLQGNGAPCVLDSSRSLCSPLPTDNLRRPAARAVNVVSAAVNATRSKGSLTSSVPLRITQILRACCSRDVISVAKRMSRMVCASAV